MIAALFVMKDGPYFRLSNIDPWDEERDARKYSGPYAVVAHPPCERWGRYSEGQPLARSKGAIKYVTGDDNGCFESALGSVRKFGGVLEHPALSKAYRYFGIATPSSRGWIKADNFGGMVCQVEQGNYGHKAHKPTWLYCVGISPPELKWGKSNATVYLSCGVSREWREAYKAVRPPRGERIGCGSCGGIHLTKRERKETPPAFRDLLISLAESVTSPPVCELATNPPNSTGDTT